MTKQPRLQMLLLNTSDVSIVESSIRHYENTPVKIHRTFYNKKGKFSD